MKRPQRPRQHAWRDRIMQRKLVRRMERVYELLIETPIGTPPTRLQNALFEDPRLKRLMGRA